MPDIAISADGLGKRYRLGAMRSNTARDAISSSLRSLLSWRRNAGDDENTLWALRGVSFEIKSGEVVGIIGRNGSGKSTLLKILARITCPTEGTAFLRGRLGSLLEIGTGFHHELTGRENIYLSGAILGMKKSEIDRSFDDIVEFAELHRFLETPVKHYSSGMYVRLAFAVAAHLLPEILLIDEVLAVGDVAFQRKCLRTMNEAAHAGRTVLFVSHDMAAINTLCDRVILLHNGEIVREGSTPDVVRYYLATQNKLYSPLRSPVQDRGEVSLVAVDVLQQARSLRVVDSRLPFDLVVDYELRSHLRNSRLGMIFRNEKGQIIFTSCDADASPYGTGERTAGRFRAIMTVPGQLLRAGVIHVTFYVDIRGDRVLFAAPDMLEIEVVDLNPNPLAERHEAGGVIAPILPWTTQALANDSPFVGERP